MIRAATTWWQAGRHPFAGVGTAQIGLDWAEVQAQKDRLVGDLRFGLTVDDLTTTLVPYLTYSESLRLAAVSFGKDLSTLSCCV